MESWQLTPCYFEAMHHLIQCGIVLINLNPRSLFHSIPPDVCFVSQLKTHFFISLHELILSARSSRRSIPIEFLPVIIVLGKDLKGKDVKINMMQ